MIKKDKDLEKTIARQYKESREKKEKEKKEKEKKEARQELTTNMQFVVGCAAVPVFIASTPGTATAAIAGSIIVGGAILGHKPLFSVLGLAGKILVKTVDVTFTVSKHSILMLDSLWSK